MSDQDIPNSVDECRAILKRYHQAREQSRKLHGHREQLDDKITDLTHQIDVDRQLFLEERVSELGKLLSAKQALMQKLKQTKLEVDHWLDAVEEMEERSRLITDRLVDLLFRDDPSSEAEYEKLHDRQNAAEQASMQLAALQKTLTKAIENLRYADENASTALLNGILRFLYFWRTPTHVISLHLDQANSALQEILNELKIQEEWLSPADGIALQRVAQALLDQSQTRWSFRTIQEVYTPLRLELEELSKHISQAQIKAEQAAKETYDHLQTWLLGNE